MPAGTGIQPQIRETVMKFKRSGIITIAIILALVVFAVIRLSTIRSQIADAEAKNKELQEQYDALTQENAELEYET